jgi:ribulose-phosphate 3-epimerase
MRLGAALFNADHTRLAEEVARLEAAGLDFIHHDVFDGHFVPDLGFSPRTIAALRPLTRLPFETHLGAVDPLRFAAPLKAAGTDLLLVHLEALTMPYEAALFIRQQGMRAGLVLTMGTPVAALEPLLPYLDAVLLLARVTGESVHPALYDQRVVGRARQVRAMIDSAGLTVDLQVAGSLKREHLPDLIAAGVNSVAFGAGLYKVPDMAAEVAAMRGLVNSR